MNLGGHNSVHNTWPHLVAREPEKRSVCSEQDSIANPGGPLVVSRATQLFTCPVLLGVSFGNTI